MLLNLSYYGNTGASPVFFGHGFPFNNTLWKRVIKRLLKNKELSRRYCYIAPNFRGMGSPQKCSFIIPNAKISKMSQFADDIAHVADCFAAEEFVYCGMSMGAYVGWELWNRYPERLKGLIIADSNASSDSAEAAENRLKTADRVEKENSCAFLADAMQEKLFAPESLKSQPKAVKRFRKMVKSNNPQGVAAAARGMTQRADFSARLKDITVPTLVLGGEFDVLSPPDSLKAIADAMPNAQHAVIPNAGHLSPLENPNAFTEILEEFLLSLK